jgi:DNA-directed RNA polymerase specialized sigma24 family protein
MPNCRSIAPAAWAHAREALVFYFSRRHGFSNAEDLAQETLAAIWIREDYEFSGEEEFLRICYGFANKVSLASYRMSKQRTTSELPADVPEPTRPGLGLNARELAVLLDEVVRAASSQLPKKDWDLIRTAAISGDNAGASAVEGNRRRVQLFRARKKLAEITGWKNKNTL